MEYVDLLGSVIYRDYKGVQEGPYEWEKVTVEENDIIMDCGANIGLFSAYAVNKGAQVYAFEPVDEIQELLKKNCCHYMDHINIVSLAISDSSETVMFSMQEGVRGGGRLSSFSRNTGKNDRKLKVQTISVDKYVEENHIPRVDFIKADIKGAERYMLAGAEKTIRRFLPKIAICTYHLEDDPTVLENLIKGYCPDYIVTNKWKKLFAYVPERSKSNEN